MILSDLNQLSIQNEAYMELHGHASSVEASRHEVSSQNLHSPRDTRKRDSQPRPRISMPKSGRGSAQRSTANFGPSASIAMSKEAQHEYARMENKGAFSSESRAASHSDIKNHARSGTYKNPECRAHSSYFKNSGGPQRKTSPIDVSGRDASNPAAAPEGVSFHTTIGAKLSHLAVV